jgi:hypothetical protein
MGYFQDFAQEAVSIALAPLGWLGHFIWSGTGGDGFDGQFDEGNDDPFTGGPIANPFTTQSDDFSISLFNNGFTESNVSSSLDSFTPSAGFATDENPSSPEESANPFDPPRPEDRSQWQASNGSGSTQGWSSYMEYPSTDLSNNESGSVVRLTPLPEVIFVPPTLTPSAASPGAPTVTPPTITPPEASDYSPEADRVDLPDVYVPTYSYPPIDTWPTAGISASPTTSLMLTPASAANTGVPMTPYPQDTPQTPQPRQDFWTRWLGDPTQTEWAIPAPDPRLIQPITHYDTGNQALNFVLNKGVIPWRNLMGSIENVAIGDLLGLSDLDRDLKQDPDIGVTYQAATTLLPLNKSIGLTAEIGLALEYATNWMSSGLSSLGPSIENILPGAGADGELPALAPLGQSDEISPLARDLDDVIRLNQLFGQKVQENAALMREAIRTGDDSLLRQWLWPNEYASYARGEMQSANVGKAIERMVAADLALDSSTSPYFVYVAGSYQPDFYGVGRLQGFFWDLTSLADKAAHESEVARWYAPRTFVWGY